MKILKHSIPVLMLLLASLISCKKSGNSPIEGIQTPNQTTIVENGRLKFENIDELVKTINRISKFSEDEFKAWEESLQGFKSLRSTLTMTSFNANKLSIPISIQSVLNQNSQYQVGNEVIYIDKEDEYIINANNHELIKQIQNKTLNTNSIDDVVHTKIKNSVSQPINFSQGMVDWDGNYKYHWEFGGFKYRFRYNATVWQDHMLLMVSVGSFFEYYKHRKWLPDYWEQAGQVTTKKITNMRWEGSHGGVFPGTINKLYPDKVQTNNKNLIVTEAFPLGSLSLKITGRFESSISTLGSKTFTQDVDWNFDIQ